MNIMLESKSSRKILSKRELCCLRLSAEDLTCHEIAKRLFISVRTVRTHRQNILKKLKCKTISGALYKAMKIGEL